MRTASRAASLILDVWIWRRAARCEFPACAHVIAPFAAPRHLTAERCSGVVWRRGCVAWMAGHCVCPGCIPVEVDGPGTGERCTCPPDAPADVV